MGQAGLKGMNAASTVLNREETKPITTIVVDDSPSFVHGFCHYLRTTPVVRVVGTAGNAFEAIDLVRQFGPQLVVMDLHLPGMPGDDAAEWIGEHFPQTRILIVSSDRHPDTEAVLVGENCAFLCKSDLMFEFEPLMERWFS